MVGIIFAVDQNNLFGIKDNEGNFFLPWDGEQSDIIKKDKSLFFNYTKNKPIIMGRNTHNSIGTILKGRLNIVLTRNITEADIKKSNNNSDIIFSNNLKQMIDLYPNAVVIGGIDIFKMMLYLYSEYITSVSISRLQIDYSSDKKKVGDGNQFLYLDDETINGFLSKEITINNESNIKYITQ